MHNSLLKTLLFCIIGLILPNISIHAEEKYPVLHFQPSFDIPVVIGTGIAVGALTLFEENLSPSHCRWCDRKSDGASNLNGLDSASRNQLLWSNHNLANNISHVTGFILTPAFTLGTHAWLNWKQGDMKSFYEDSAVISEATLIAGLVGQIVQFSVGRERPDAHFSNVRTDRAAQNTSFYSGHSTIAFALATSSGTVATLRHREEAPWIWAGGLALAGFTSYLRLAADRHYLTDVLVGSVAGSVIGFTIPYFFHSPEESKTVSHQFHWMVLPSQKGLLAALDWNW